MLDTDQFLQPIAGSNPSGLDLEYDSRFQEVRSLIEGGSEEEPIEWKKVRKQCLDLLNDGRHLELIVLLCASSVATDGYEGLRDSLRILEVSLSEFWDSLYPELDMEDPEDERYDIRLNLIAQLGEQPRKMGDQLGFVEKVLRAPLSPTGSPAPCYWTVWLSNAGDEVDKAELGTIQDFCSRMPSEERGALVQFLDDSVQSIKAINQFLLERTGSSFNGPFDEYLLPTLEKLKSFLSAQASEDGLIAESVEAAAEDPGGASAPVAQVAAPVGSINSTADVKKALEKITAYYRKAEPSSPVPYLLQRAYKLIDADFIEIIKNLNQDSEHQFRTTLDINESD